MTDGRDSPAAPAPAPPAHGQLTPAEKVMLVVLIALVSGVFVSMVGFQQQIGALEERIGRRMDRRMDRIEERMDRLEERMYRIEERMGGLDERMARLEAIVEVHFGTPPVPADSAGDSAPAQ